MNKLVADLQLLAEEAPEQISAIGTGLVPGKEVLKWAYSCDPGFDTPGYLSHWGLIDDRQYQAILDVHEATQQIRNGGVKLTAATLREAPAWRELRRTARHCLTSLTG